MIQFCRNFHFGFRGIANNSIFLYSFPPPPHKIIWKTNFYECESNFLDKMLLFISLNTFWDRVFEQSQNS